MKRIPKSLSIAVLLAVLTGVTTATAGTLPFKKARLLQRGMSAAEVLYLVGPPDFRQLKDAYWTNVQSWFYIPGATDSDPWQTVIHFDQWGNIRQVDRDKIIGRPYR